MANTLQINLDNDTANFRTQHSALVFAQTHRPKNTQKAYNRVCKEWKSWCERLQYDNGDLVHEAKLVRFLFDEVINRSLRILFKKRKHDETESDANLVLTAQLADDVEPEEKNNIDFKTLKFQSIRGYKIGLINHYFY